MIVDKASREADGAEANVVAVENLIADVQYVIEAVMQDGGVTRRELARRLGKSETTISRQLDDSSNLTLRTIATIFTALDDQPEITSRRFKEMKAGKAEDE